MNWSNDKSLWLSKFCTRLFAMLLAVIVCGAPFFLAANRSMKLLLGYTIGDVLWYLAAAAAGAAACAGVALYRLSRLLHAIGKGDVFSTENVAHLRALSWCCLVAGLFFLSSCWYAPTCTILAAAAAFVGLILRVVKNVFAQAVALKHENDLTI